VIAISIYLCEAYLAIPPNFSLFKYYFVLKYLSSAANRQVIGGIGIHDRANRDFLALLLKTSLKGYHTQWFYCENHKPSLTSFVGQLLKFEGSFIEEPTTTKMPVVLVLAKKVSKLK
jgi:hypothetical protein